MGSDTRNIMADSLLPRITMIDSTNLIPIMMMNTLGLSIIYAEFKRAMWHYSMPNYHPKTSSDSLAFIEGTGLDLVCQAYGLMYDVVNLRNTFFSMVGDHAKIEYTPMKRINENAKREEE